MPTKINMHLEFVSDTGTPRHPFTYSVSHEDETTDDRRENLAREIFAELRKAISYSDYWNSLPDVGDLAQPLSISVAAPTDPMAFIDLFNKPAVWLEIDNTFTDLRHVLAEAKAYKDLEPPNTKPTTDSLCAHLHFEKMYRLNLGVFQLVKIQDLIVRLLHESFSGKLITVDFDDEDWEKKLTLKDAKKGLEAFADNGDLSGKDYQAILAALDLPSKSPHQDTVIRYRNRLTHRIRPSVDYVELFTDLQDRAGQVIKDASGKEKGRAYRFGGGRSRPDFLFADLYTALSDYMSHVAEMLKALKAIPRLS